MSLGLQLIAVLGLLVFLYVDMIWNLNPYLKTIPVSTQVIIDNFSAKVGLKIENQALRKNAMPHHEKKTFDLGTLEGRESFLLHLIPDGT